MLLTAQRTDGGPRLSEGAYAGLATTLAERVVTLASAPHGAAERRVSQLSSGSLLGPTLRCMHDEGFVAAAHEAIFESGSLGEEVGQVGKKARSAACSVN